MRANPAVRPNDESALLHLGETCGLKMEYTQSGRN